LGHLLLLKRSNRSKNNVGKWAPPGGKTEVGESFDEALLREVAEETGLVVSILYVVGLTELELPL
jgi:ADP-ribose pyrophosphatase YjhB (NUDIX family)